MYKTVELLSTVQNKITELNDLEDVNTNLFLADIVTISNCVQSITLVLELL